MTYFKDVQCIRCGAPLGKNKFYQACPRCIDKGTVNYTTVYDVRGAKLPNDSAEPGLFRYRDFLPLAKEAKPVSIGEGNTPLIKLERLAP